MGLKEFCSLPIEEQIEHLYEEAVYIGKRKRHFRTTLLFQLESFYVEVQYAQYRQVVNQIYCTTATSVIDGYLDQINVEDLVGC